MEEQDRRQWEEVAESNKDDVRPLADNIKKAIADFKAGVVCELKGEDEG